MFSILRALHKVSVFSPKKHEESFPYLEMCEDKRNKLPAGVKHAPCEVLQESDYCYSQITSKNLGKKETRYFPKYNLHSYLKGKYLMALK
jgi:hypothetical protein